MRSITADRRSDGQEPSVPAGIGHGAGNKRQSFYENRGIQEAREERRGKYHEPLIDRETFDMPGASAQKRNTLNLGRFTRNHENILKGWSGADCKRPLVRYKNVSHEKAGTLILTHANDIGNCPLKTSGRTHCSRAPANHPARLHLPPIWKPSAVNSSQIQKQTATCKQAGRCERAPAGGL